MATRMTENGVSTCRKAGSEQFEKFQTGFGRRKRTLVVAPTLEECRRKCNGWLSAKGRRHSDE